MLKNNFFASFSWTALALTIAAICGVASAQNIKPIRTPLAATAQSPSITLPDTPQVMWSRILILLKNNGGFVTHKKVEEVLGLKFTSLEKDDEKRVPRLGAQVLYLMEEEVQGLGLVKMSLFEDPKKTGLSLSWDAHNYDEKTCLQLKQVVDDIEVLGWSPGQARSIRPGPSSWLFLTRDTMAESAKTGKPLMTYAGTSSLVIRMPNQNTNCVNGFSAHIWRP